MAPITPYTHDLGGHDPLQAFLDSAHAIETLTHNWSAHDYERRYAPGKWTARQVIIHLAQSELALGTRARMAVSTPNYTAQPFDQDAWMTREEGISGTDATAALVAMMRMNRAFFAGLSDTDRESGFAHPEYGSINVDWILHQMAGHHIHHLQQLKSL